MKKDIRLEAIRVLSIFLVILIHFCNYYTKIMEPTLTVNYMVAMFYNVTARVCVPLFFMISGALGLKKEFDFDKNKKKILHMLLVLVVWSVIYWLWNYFFLERDMLSQGFIVYLFDPLKNHLWYLYAYIALLIAQPLTALLAKHMDRHTENYFIIAWLLLCGGVRILDSVLDYYEVTAGLRYAVPMIQSTYYFGYYLCGHILYKRLSQGEKCEKILSLKKGWYIFVALLSIIACWAMTCYFSIEVAGETDKSLFAYSSSLIMIPTVCIFLFFLKANIRESKIIYALGNSSFGIYLSHLIFFSILYVCCDLRTLGPVFWLPALTLLILLISMAFVEVTRRIPGLRKILY
ncbi:MAG: acyltransferase family protein [Clostridiales bacterium]|nr:acyltransferase family protein [Clostridiales bacterium]